jgi:Protein of unknown function (DUF2934)
MALKPEKKASDAQELGAAAEANGVGPTHEEIQKRAYEIHMERGGAHGQDQSDWFLAEQELTARHTRSGNKS